MNRVNEISSSTLGKCDRPEFSFGDKLCHCRSLHICYFLWCDFAWRTTKPHKFVPSFPLPLGLRAFPNLHSSSLVSRCGNHGWMVTTDELYHLHLFCFSGPSMILNVILGHSNLFIFEIPRSKLWSLGQHRLQDSPGYVPVFHIYL